MYFCEIFQASSVNILCFIFCDKCTYSISTINQLLCSINCHVHGQIKSLSTVFKLEYQSLVPQTTGITILSCKRMLHNSR